MKEAHFYDRELEVSDRAALREIQEKMLLSSLGELQASGFYTEKLQAAGTDPSAVRRIEDIQSLPFTTKGELAAEQIAHPPFGRLLTQPVSRYRYFHQTSGTTGRPLKCLDTEVGWQWMARCFGYVYGAAGVTAEDIVFCAFSFGPYLSHWAAISGARHAGALSISGGGMNSEQRLNAILANRCTVLVCTPTYALHLAEVARERAIDLSASDLRISIHAGEPGASLPSVKRLIEESFGTICFDHAGATEVGPWAFDCGLGNGAIHLNEAEFIFEVVEPEGNRPVGEGERGELVVTNPGRAGMPLLRYRTGDLVEMTSAPCACGRQFSRIKGGVLGRTDDMLIVRGVNIYPSAIDNVIRSFLQVVEYEVEIRRVRSLDELLVKVEIGKPARFEAVKEALLDRLRSELNIRVSVDQAATGSLPRYEFKASRYKRIARL